jgi:hypothetical protein
MDGSAFDEPLDGEPLRFLSVVLDTANFECCWITRRWKTASRDPVAPPESEDFIGAFCENPVGLLRSQVFRDLEKDLGLPSTIEDIGRHPTLYHYLVDLASFGTGPNPQRQRESHRLINLAEDIVLAADGAATVGEFIHAIIRLLRDSERFNLLASLSEKVMDDQHRWVISEDSHGRIPGTRERYILERERRRRKPVSSGEGCEEGSAQGRRLPSHQILDTAVYSRSDRFDNVGAVCGWSGACYRVRSAEYFFDAQATSYLTFIDQMAERARLVVPIGGVGLRFMRGWPRSLSMQRAPLTVAVEVATARDIDEHALFMETVDGLARNNGGIPHWGQEHQVTTRQVEQMYGSALEEFKWAVAEVERSRSGVFSNQFTRDHGLEPNRPLEEYQAERYIAALLHCP